MSKLVGVSGMVVPDIWSEIEPFVARCLDKVEEYRWKPDDILRLLANNEMQLWLCIDDRKLLGIVITELSRYPQSFDCSLFMMAGEMPDDWKDHLHQLEDWAKSMGCTHMATTSRPGSAKLIGYSKGLIHTFRSLQDG